SRLAPSCRHTVEALGATMRLLLTFLICLLVGVALDRFRFAGRALLHALHRARELHHELFRDVLAGLARGGPYHRTAPAPSGGGSAAGVSGRAAVYTGRYCWLGEPRMENSGSVSPNAAPFFPAATPTS